MDEHGRPNGSSRTAVQKLTAAVRLLQSQLAAATTAAADAEARAQRATRATVFLGLLLAFSAAACNGGPTRPIQEDRFGLYTGRWRGNINGLEVVLDMQAERGFGLPSLGGTGTALNSATGEIHRLTISGFGTIVDAESTASFNLFTPDEIRPGVSLERHTGSFTGNVSRDGRTWPGRWISTTSNDGAPIFGPGEHSVTLNKG